MIDDQLSNPGDGWVPAMLVGIQFLALIAMTVCMILSCIYGE